VAKVVSNPSSGPVSPDTLVQRLEAALRLAIQHHQAGRPAEAEALYRHVLAVCPDHPDTLHFLGLLADQTGRHETAVDLIGRALRAKEADPSCHNNLGNALKALGRSEEAMACYRRALALKPDYAEACYNLGSALQASERIDEAANCYRRVLAIKPDFAEALGNLGGILLTRERYDEAAACFERALALRADSADILYTLGKARIGQNRLGEAAACFERATILRPGYADAHYNLGFVRHAEGRAREAVAHCEAAVAIAPDFVGALQLRLFALLYLEGFPAAAVAAEYVRCGKALMAHAAPGSVAPFSNSRDHRRRLRVGYVSGDLRRHPVSFFLEPLLSAHDRAGFEIFCYSERPVSGEDEVTARLRALADHWLVTIGLSDGDLAARIRTDGIDILVDLAGYSAHNRLAVFAHRPAPVQATWLGYPNTTGLPTIDYRLVDAVTDPEGVADAFATETLVRLDGGFLCYGPPADAPEPGAPPCLESGAVTFGSFNNPAKLSESTLETWATLLLRLPAARLLLKGHAFADPAFRARIRQYFVQRGVDAGRTELLAPIRTTAGHLEAYRRIDIALDPFPYNGTTTTCEALWMGVPVVTLLGDRHAARVGASLLTHIGLKELIAASRDDYLDLAIDLAGDQERMAVMRSELRPLLATSSLCDAGRFARAIEHRYREMWTRWVSARPSPPC